VTIKRLGFAGFKVRNVHPSAPKHKRKKESEDRAKSKKLKDVRMREVNRVNRVNRVNVCFKNITNLQNKGLISADRGTKATLMRTIPRSLFKSYTKDLSLPIFELVFQPRLHTHFMSVKQCRDNVMILGDSARLHLYVLMITSGKATYRRFPA
jgi:hypothetical protein